MRICKYCGCKHGIVGKPLYEYLYTKGECSICGKITAVSICAEFGGLKDEI